MSDLFFNISGFVLGVLGVVGTVQAFYATFNRRLPRYRAKRLEEMYNNAYTLLRCGVEEGLLPKSQVQRMEDKLLWYVTSFNLLAFI